MRLRKTLAYGDGKARKPEKTKALAFALIAPLMAACAAHAAPVPQHPARAEAIAARTPAKRAVRDERDGPACGADLDAVLRPGERVVEAVCRHGREFVLTGDSLLIVTRAEGREFSFEALSPVMHASRTDMEPYLSRGLLAWEPSETDVYVLTGDRVITVLPNEGMGDSVSAYTMWFDVAGITRKRMVYFAGALFVAPMNGGAVALTLSDDIWAQGLGIGPGSAEDGFSVRKRRLFFGSGGNEAEIKAVGPGAFAVEK